MDLPSFTDDMGPMPDILLVEDNPLHVRLVKSMLADIWRDSETLRFAKRLDRALDMVRQQTPACVLLDLVLPDADNLDALKAMLAAAPGVPIVVLSAHEDDEMAMRAVREGAQDYLVKGTIGAEQLAKSIYFAMQRHRMDRQNDVLPEIPLAEVSAGLAAAVAIIDREGAIVYADPAVADLLGVELGRLVGVPLASLSYPNDVEAFARVVRNGTDEPVELTVRLRHASGNDVRVRLELRPLSDGIHDGAAFLARYHVLAEFGTAASGAYTVFTEWV
jgi:PAS domain S-box-containing protein